MRGNKKWSVSVGRHDMREERWGEVRTGEK